MTSPMRMALAEAERAARRGEVPVGAVLLDSAGRVLARDGNRIVEYCDPTAHAEMLVIRAAARTLGQPRLEGCVLWVTLEPCPMCATAISFARLARVCFGAWDPKGGGVDHGPRVYDHATCHHRPDAWGGFDAGAAATLLRAFFMERR